MGGWKQHTSLLMSSCPIKEADVKPFGNNLRLHDISKDNCQTGSLLQRAVKTKTAGEVYNNVPIHSFYIVVASKDGSYRAKEDSVGVPLTGAL